MTYVSDRPNNFRTDLGAAIFKAKYALYPDETWLQRCQAVVDDVCGTRGGITHPLMSKPERAELVQIMHGFRFLPGGRYLYYGGRPASYYNNCYLFAGEQDTREEWGRLVHSASNALMSGGGIGVDYSIFRARGTLLRRTGGVASGPIPLANSINEIGRNVMQGGSRRSAIYGSLNWQHGDATSWLTVKDWGNLKIPGTNVSFAQAKSNNFDAQAPLDFTNISLNYDNAFLSEVSGVRSIVELEKLVKDEAAWHTVVDTNPLPSTFIKNVEMAMSNGEPGFSFNFFDQEGSTLRNACCTKDTRILTKTGYKAIGDLVGKEVEIWNGEEWAPVTPFSTGWNSLVNVELSDGSSLRCTPYHKFVTVGLKGWNNPPEFVPADELQIGERLAKFDMPVVEGGEDVDGAPDAYSQGFYSAEGNKGLKHSWVYKPKYPCTPRLCGTIKDTTGPFAELKKTWKHGTMLPKNWVPLDSSLEYRLNWLAGLLDGDGCVTKDKNGNGIQIASIDHGFLKEVKLMLTTLGVKAKVVHANDKGTRDMPNGKGSLSGYNCKETKRLLIGNTDTVKLLSLGTRFSRLGVSKDSLPQRDARRFVTVRSVTELPIMEETFCFTEPKTHRGTFEGHVLGQCTEVVSADDSDMCNIGSVNMAACENLEQFKTAVELASKFLVCGTIRGILPDEKTRLVREKNRRIGLGIMGVHEWLLQRNYRYEITPELHEWLKVYATNGEAAAREHCDRFYISQPVAYRAVAPTGTIGTIAGTTTGIEPIFAVAYKRRYLEGDRETGREVRKFQYYVDQAAKDLMTRYGIDPDKIETAIDLAKDPERRIKFQADVQDYVDMGISSTLNLPGWDTEGNHNGHVDKFAKIVAKYAPRLRGLTSYPDGSRGGQPLVSVPYAEAIEGGIGVVYEENSDRACVSGVCGI